MAFKKSSNSLDFHNFRELNGLTEASGGHQHGRRCQGRLHGQGLGEQWEWGEKTSALQQHKSLAVVSHVLADSFKDLVQIYKGM